MNIPTILLASLLSFASGSFATPTVILAPVRDQDAWGDNIRPEQEDAEYRFICRSFGNHGGQTPAMFVFSKRAKKWMQILKLSTDGAKLGRSPDPKEAPLLQVGWDYSGLASEPYAVLPLRTSGSIDFPREVVLDPQTQMYAFRFDTGFKSDYVLTVFYVRKADLDNAFQ